MLPKGGSNGSNIKKTINGKYIKNKKKKIHSFESLLKSLIAMDNKIIINKKYKKIKILIGYIKEPKSKIKNTHGIFKIKNNLKPLLDKKG